MLKCIQIQIEKLFLVAISFGMHKHETGNNINYIVSGMGKAICDDDEESLFAGICHICKEDFNIGTEDFAMITIVVEQQVLIL